MPSEYIQLDPRKRREEVISLARELGFGVVGGKRPQLDPAMPDMTTFVDDLAGPGIYSLALGMAHAEVWAMVRHQQPVDMRMDALDHRLSSEEARLGARVDDLEQRFKQELNRRIEFVYASTRRGFERLRRNARQRHSDLERRRLSLTLIGMGGICSSVSALISIAS